MEALKINPSSENDIKLHNEKIAKKKELDTKRTDLYRQIKKLNDDESELNIS